MKSSFLLVLALSFLPCSAEVLEKARTCRVIFVDRPRDAPEEVQLFDGISSRKVSLSDMNFSDVIKLPSGDLSLSLSQHPISNAEEIPAESPTVKISAGITDFYLMVTSDPGNKTLPLKMLPVDSGDEHPKLGETLWINLSQHKIKADLGDTSFTIAPGQRLVGQAPLPASGYYKAEFQYQPDGEGDFLPVMNKSWWFDATSRNLGFIIETGERLPKIFTFRDQQILEPE